MRSDTVHILSHERSRPFKRLVGGQVDGCYRGRIVLRRVGHGHHGHGGARAKFATLLRLLRRLLRLLLLLLRSPLLLLLVKACSCCSRILLLLMHHPERVGLLVLQVCAPAMPLTCNEKLPPLLL